MEQIFLSQEELQQVNQLNSERADLISKFGTIEYEIQNLELDKKKLTEQLIELNKKSLQTGDELQQKYGEGNINIETGEFVKR
jgi:predicted  nucleic acid-binding Zn-ribbon protein